MGAQPFAHPSGKSGFRFHRRRGDPYRHPVRIDRGEVLPRAK
jgi:hypothetical protein